MSVTSSSLGLLPVPHWVTGTVIKKGSVTSSSLGLLPVLHWVTGTVIKKKKGRRVTKTFHMFPLVLGDFF